HHGFTTEYDTSRPGRWMGVLNLDGNTPVSLKKQFDSQRNRNINKAINFGVRVRFLEREEFDIFLSLYREPEIRAGFVSKQDEYFYNFIDNYGDKSLIPLAYIDLDEYVTHTQESINEKEARRDQMMQNENKSDKQLKKIAEIDKQIEHDKKELLHASELRQ